MAEITTDDPRVEALMVQVRRAGGRVTAARRLVAAALLDASSHPTAETVAAAVHAEHPELHLSTIYRTLESLEALGLVEHTHVGHGPAVYHVGEMHQHLVCERCGTIIDLDSTHLEALERDVHERYGFRLHIGHFAMLGRCRDCGSS